MRYYKSMDSNVVAGINTVDIDGEGNITQAEYNTLKAMLNAMPDGKCIVDNGGTYSYADRPPAPEPDPTSEEALEILLGGDING